MNVVGVALEIGGVRRVERGEVGGELVCDSGHRDRVVPKVRVGRAIREAQQVLYVDDVSLPVR